VGNRPFFRTATCDVRVGVHVVPDGNKILMFLGAANRDPRRWDDPDRFDLSRDPSGHVGFGFGIHQCAGQHVTRLEAEALRTARLDG
jgi:cytochrome P450